MQNHFALAKMQNTLLQLHSKYTFKFHPCFKFKALIWFAVFFWLGLDGSKVGDLQIYSPENE
jgi:hypothetical protein